MSAESAFGFALDARGLAGRSASVMAKLPTP
jgi:hypothetical protein